MTGRDTGLCRRPRTAPQQAMAVLCGQESFLGVRGVCLHRVLRSPGGASDSREIAGCVTRGAASVYQRVNLPVRPGSIVGSGWWSAGPASKESYYRAGQRAGTS